MSDTCPPGRGEGYGTRDDDVAVEAADPAELEQARAEGRREAEEAMGEKLAAAEREKAAEVEKAREKLAAAREEAKEAKASVRAAHEAADKAREEAARLKKELEAASNKDIAAFQVGFENVQKGFTGLLDNLKNMKKAGDVEHHDKLVDAVRALLDALGKQVPEKAGGAGC